MKNFQIVLATLVCYLFLVSVPSYAQKLATGLPKNVHIQNYEKKFLCSFVTDLRTIPNSTPDWRDFFVFTSFFRQPGVYEIRCNGVYDYDLAVGTKSVLDDTKILILVKKEIGIENKKKERWIIEQEEDEKGIYYLIRSSTYEGHYMKWETGFMSCLHYQRKNRNSNVLNFILLNVSSV